MAVEESNDNTDDNSSADVLYGDNDDKSKDDDANANAGKDDDTKDDEGSDDKDESSDDKSKDSEDGSSDEDSSDDDSKDDDDSTDDASLIGAPETYEAYALPENVTFSEEATTKFGALAKRLNLSQKGAQELVDFQAAQAAEAFENQAQAIEQEVAERTDQWAKDAKADPEFGGEALEANLAIATLAIEKHGNEKFTQLLKDSGLGSHPEVIRFMVNTGRGLSEDTTTPGGKGGETKSRASVMYPDMK